MPLLPLGMADGEGEMALVLMRDILRTVHEIRDSSAALRERVDELDITLRGERGENGVTSRVNQLEREVARHNLDHRAMIESLAGEVRQVKDTLHLKLYQQPESDETARERWKARGQWALLGLGVVGAIMESIHIFKPELFP